MKKKILFIATSSFRTPNKKILNSLRKKNVFIKTNPLKRKLNEKEIIKYSSNASYIIAGTEKYTQKALNCYKNLKCIYRIGSGFDNIPIEILKKNKIKFYKSKITPEKAVAELIVGYIIILYRNIISHNENLKNKVWKKEMGSLVFGKTVGIIGFGRVGKYLKKLLSNFGVKILINDFKLSKIDNSNINKILKNSDIVTVNTSLINTKKILDKKKLSLLNKRSLLINTSRSEAIDYKYLFYLLKNNKIQGAALDVYENEPYFGELTKLNNVILTPHIGGYASEVRKDMEEEALLKICDIVR